AVTCAWAASLPPFCAGQATGGAPFVALALGLGLGRGEGDGVVAAVGDGRATVGVGVGAAVVGAAEVAGGATDWGEQAPATTIAMAQYRRVRAVIVVPV